MNQALTKTPILLLFFNRPETLEKVFEAVKRARPAKLFLAQDGARIGNPDDPGKILRCREIVENIDWECEIIRDYAETNLSCDHREFTAISNAFQKTDRLIILEDDCVPCDSFFPFCDELLERYKDDTRIDRISGFNRLGEYKDISTDYFFSTIAAGYGWATWKRVWTEIEKNQNYEFLEDPNLVTIYNKSRDIIADRNYEDMLKACADCRKKDKIEGKITSWEMLVGVNSLINHSLIITPRCNMVKNIGATADATHYTELKYTDHVIRRTLENDAIDVTFPLKHPNHVLRDANYEKLHYRRIHRSPVKRVFLKIEVLFKRLIHGDFKGIGKAIRRRIHKGK